MLDSRNSTVAPGKIISFVPRVFIFAMFVLCRIKIFYISHCMWKPTCQVRKLFFDECFFFWYAGKVCNARVMHARAQAAHSELVLSVPEKISADDLCNDRKYCLCHHFYPSFGNLCTSLLRSVLIDADNMEFVFREIMQINFCSTKKTTKVVGFYSHGKSKTNT